MGGPACKRRASQAADPAATLPVPVLSLGEIAVADVTDPPPRLKLDAAGLAADLRARLLGSGVFGPKGGGAAGPVTRVRLQVATEVVEVKDKGVARAALRVRIETRPRIDGMADEDLSMASEQVFSKNEEGKSEVERAAVVGALVRRSAMELVDGWIAGTRLRTATPVELHAALGADAGELREEAIRQVGQRGIRQEVPALLELLGHPEERIRDAALGALLEMRERRAVPVLTKSRSFRDGREMRKILDAVATLGGEEAMDYLAFVAETHDDAEIRQMAASAKARLERRTASSSPAP